MHKETNVLKAHKFPLFVFAIGFLFCALLFVIPAHTHAASLGSVTDITPGSDGQTFEITTGKDKVKVLFYGDDIVRIWLGVDGKYTEPAGKKLSTPTVPIVDKNMSDFDPATVSMTDEGDYYKLASEALVLRVYKQPLTFAMYKKDNKTLVWEETESLNYGAKTVQKLSRGEDEYFYGGGVQHGIFSHRDQKIKIEFGGGWDSGAVSNPSPFYMSTNGYGVLRNTFQVGSYDFKEPLELSHDENRFDAFYFYGDSLKDVLNKYTDVTGKPNLIPRWAMGMGDANCYNRSPQKTSDVINLIAKKYREYDMPGAWILPNDGYGCGYTDLKYTVDELEKLGFKTGLWTENGVAKIAQEVGEFGTRAAKLDVAWVGPGYDFALNATKITKDGIENNSDARAYIWSVGGWAGTQRYSAVWTGDQSGSWEYIRFHIPTYISGGLSGIPYTLSDVDGIFGGSAKTQVRDLQWKMFTPSFLNMSGWASRDKQPWVWGEPYTSINREYLKLRQRLTPYLYTNLNESYEAATPLVRGMVLEFPDDPNTKGPMTQYQFMSGEYFLVAPVYSDTVARHNIYLPKGKWIDYWSGENHYGSKMLNDYDAPLDRLPLLVKAGAIIPMYPDSLYDGEVPPDPITFDIYPYLTSSFELYEDDGITREHRSGRFAKTLIESIAPAAGTGDLVVKVGESKGDYNGKLAERKNHFTIHMPNKPSKVALGSETYTELSSKSAWESAAKGWYYDASDRGGILYVKTPSLPTNKAFSLTVSGFVADETPLKDAEIIIIPGVDTDPARIPQADMTATATNSDSMNPPANLLDENRETIWSTKLDGSAALPQSVTLDLGIEHYIQKVKVLPRQYGGDAGTITKYKLYVSKDGQKFTEVASGDWKNDPTEKTITFDTVQASFVRLEALEGVGGLAAISEFNVYRDPQKPAPVLIPKAEMKATTTSYQSGSDASKVLDGDPNTVWHTKWDLSDKLPQSITIDLGKTRKISQFRYGPRLDSGNGTITTYKLYISIDGKTFTQIAGGDWVRNNKFKYVQFEPVSARYVKLEAIVGVGGFASAREIDVYEAPLVIDDEIKLISEGKPATASSEDPAHPASHGNDGNSGTRWSANDTQTGHTWSLDLGKNFSIRQLEVAFEHPDKVYQYKLEVRDAGNPNWITVVDRTKNTEAGAAIVNDFGSLGRYVRLTITGLPDGAKASFWEAKLFGSETSTGGDGEFITGVTLDKQQIDLLVNGAYELLTAKIEPGTALNQNVTWKSDNPAVAKVDSQGKVTPVGEGKTKITVTTEEGGWTASADVTVYPASSDNEVEAERIPQTNMTATATSAQTGNGEGADKAIDNDPNTMWHVRYFAVDPLPQSITINLGAEYYVNQLKYLPRQSGTNGFITMYNVYTSTDGVNFKKVASGSWASNKNEKIASFPGVYATYVRLEAVEGVGGMASAAEINIYQGQPPAEEQSTALTGPESVKENEAFAIEFGLQNIASNVTAQDITFHYDSNRFAFIDAESMTDGINILKVVSDTPGKLRLLIVSEGLQHAIKGDKMFVKLHFKALEGVTAPSEIGKVEIVSALVADEQGVEYSVALSALDITVLKDTVITIPGDLNGDGKVSIGDLAMVAMHYGKDSSSPDWGVAKIADINGDGKVDIQDLVLLARMILE